MKAALWPVRVDSASLPPDSPVAACQMLALVGGNGGRVRL